MESLNPNSPFVIEAVHTLKWSSFWNQHDKRRQHRHESLVTAKQIDREMYLRGMPHPARDDGLKPTAVTEWEWAFNQAIAIWLAGQMSRSSDDENSPMDDSQRTSERSGSSNAQGDVIEVDPFGPSASVDEVIPETQDKPQYSMETTEDQVSPLSSPAPVVKDTSASVSPDMVPVAMETTVHG